MSAQPQNHYEILGLTPSATQEDIKRRYRELARRYHPDVSKTPDAALRFTEINEANGILSDAAKRANYDAHLKLAEMKRENAAAESRTTAEPRQPSPSRPAPGQRSSSSSTGSAARKPSEQAAKKPKTDEVALILQEAQKAMSRLKFREAEVLCRRANKIRRTSLSYEILGDIYRSRNRTDDAVAMYSYALQLDRTNRDVQQKFDRLVGKPSSGATMAGNAARASSRSAARPTRTNPAPASKSGARAAVTLIGVVILGVVIFAASRIGSPATGPWFFEWDMQYVVSLACAGAMLGFLLALNGIIPPARDELAASGNRRGRSVSLPLGPLVMAFALLSFYAALVVFVIAGFLYDRLTRPMQMAFGAAFALTIVFAMANVAAAQWTMLSGGNVVFLALVGGWAAGGSLHEKLRG